MESNALESTHSSFEVANLKCTGLGASYFVVYLAFVLFILRYGQIIAITMPMSSPLGRRTTSSSTSSRQLSLASLNSRPDRFVRMSWTNVVGSSALYYLSHSRDIMHFAAWSTVEGILFRSALLPLRIAEKFECELFSLSSFHLQACLMKEPARRAGGVNSYTTNQSVLAIL